MLQQYVPVKIEVVALERHDISVLARDAIWQHNCAGGECTMFNSIGQLA